jgi:Lipid A 3-O-deacylase (PagL)
MQLKFQKSVIFTLAFCFSLSAHSATHFGGNVSLPLVAKEPTTIHGYQLMLNYDPDRFRWRQFNLYFDGGFSHLTTNTSYNSSINIYSMAPVVRYTFDRRGLVSPFFELSIGLSYLNQTRFQNRNLGIHFAFQDRLGIGALLGQTENLLLGVHAVHYSNAHLSSHNSGITIPLVLEVGYRF